MIFAVIIISALAFAGINVFAKNRWQTMLSFLFALLFFAGLALMTANDHYHFGMKQVTETTTEPLVSSSDNKEMNLLLYQPLGDGTEKVYVYKTNEKQKKPLSTGTDHVTNEVKENQTSNQLVTKKTYWVYKNKTAELWFGLSSENHQLVKEENSFSVKKDWIVLSTEQAKDFGKLVEENKTKMEAEAKIFVQDQVQAAMVQDPTMDQAAQQKVIEQATTTYQEQAMAKLVAEVKDK